MSGTIARSFGDYCAAVTSATIDDGVVDYSKQLLLDTLGTAVGGFHWSDTTDMILGTARLLDPSAGHGDVTVLATGEQMTPANAALANGALSHSLDYDNRHSAGSLHIGSAIIPAALAAAQVQHTTGERLLDGIIAGYDVAARLGMACNPRSSHERGFHPTGTCGTFGATAAVGVIMEFTPADFVNAFGLNGSQAAGSYQCSIGGGWNKRIHPGLAARNALVAAAFIDNGFEGPDAPIGGELGFLQAYADSPLPERATTGLGEVFEVARTKIKPYPVGTFAHVPIALLIELAATESLDPATIESITVTLPTAGATMFGREPGDSHPTSSVEAQFDMPFAAALAVTYRDAGLTSFTDALKRPIDRVFGQLMDRTRTVASDDLQSHLPERYPARVTVTTETETYERFRTWVRGEPDHPLTWDEMERKFTDLTPSFSDDSRDEIIAVVRGLESKSIVDLLEPFQSVKNQ